MIETERLARNSQRLGECYPSFGARVRRALNRLEAVDERPRIQDAYRSPAAQLLAWQSGHSHLRWGFHNVTGANAHPEALAVDVLDDNHPLASPPRYCLQLAAAAEAEGLETGIRWGLPTLMVDAIDAALEAGDWDAPVKLGWDPTHVQPADITEDAAHRGARPA